MPLVPSLQQVLDTLLSSLYNLQTAVAGGQKRYYSAIFRDLPDRRLYPDYYHVIREPRCLHDVMNNMHRGLYSSPQAVAYDLFLIWSNAREYNEQGSLVYADADKLEPAAPTGADREPERKVKRIKLTGSLAGGSTGSSVPTLDNLPPIASTSSVSSAAGTPTLKLKLGGPRPTPVAAPPPRANPSPAAAPVPEHSAPAPIAPTQPDLVVGPVADIAVDSTASTSTASTTHPSAVAVTATSTVTGAGTGDDETKPAAASTVPTIADVESGWLDGPADAERLANIANRLRTYTDASGRVLATPLVDVPEPASRPDYYKLVTNPISLNVIEERIRAGFYTSAEAFDRDLHRLFEVAKLFIRPDATGTAYSDLMVLQRLYQELTKNDSSADRSVESASAASLASVSGGPGNVLHSKGEDGAQGSDYKNRATTRPTTRDKIFLDGIHFKGQTLRTGDWVHLLNPDSPGKPIIAQIWKTYKKPDSTQRCLSVCWYYRPEETVHPVTRTFYENEVFKTGVFVDHNIEDFLGSCFVMFFTRYTRGRPKAWDPSMPLYVCEHRYKDEAKQFKKIKSWSSCIPEEIRAHEYDFEPYADNHVDQLTRVKSPFTRGVPGPGRLDSAQANVVPSASPAYHFSTDGKPQTAEEANFDISVTPLEPPSAALLGVAAAPPPSVVAPSVPATVAPPPAAATAPPAVHVEHLAPPASVPALPQIAGTTFDVATGSLGSLQAFNVPAGSTPAELAASKEACSPIPGYLKSKFRGDTFGELLWFSAPAATVPPVKRPAHSLAYLLWQTEQRHSAA
ncbi:hypothetical protein BMF94_4003 [Rhodotorula taiwanensis]|uniref:BAH domain-containing protein n=1 Tax=Rhodotorula taiwanensis TaxID=741276 RepID=A0A2S5B841_9BASI|nr:hypothetical protein BMF94_4003 [Rhodotorula taiwanensis]